MINVLKLYGAWFLGAFGWFALDAHKGLAALAFAGAGAVLATIRRNRNVFQMPLGDALFPDHLPDRGVVRTINERTGRTAPSATRQQPKRRVRIIRNARGD